VFSDNEPYERLLVEGAGEQGTEGRRLWVPNCNVIKEMASLPGTKASCKLHSGHCVRKATVAQYCTRRTEVYALSLS
jgi:hypothetical protein